MTCKTCKAVCEIRDIQRRLLDLYDKDVFVWGDLGPDYSEVFAWVWPDTHPDELRRLRRRLLEQLKKAKNIVMGVTP